MLEIRAPWDLRLIEKIKSQKSHEIEVIVESAKKNSKSNIDEAIKFCTNFIVSGVKANQNV